MATYYTTSSNQREAPMMYQEGQFLPGNAVVYLNNPPVSFTDTLGGMQPLEAPDSAASHQQHHEVMSNLRSSSRIAEMQDFSSWRESSNRNGLLVMHPVTSATSLLQGGQHLQGGQGLSLSLGTQILPGIHQLSPISYRNPSASGTSRDEQPRNGVEYASPGFSGGNQTSSIARNIPNSKYLKAAQQLLDEVVNVRKALKQFQPDREKNEDYSSEQLATNSKEGSEPGVTNTNSSNAQDLSANASSELSQSDRQELQNKLTKLLAMLDEVDRRYKQYYHQMQIVVSSFDVIAGCGAAKPYTTLALQTISRHFRCLRDAISEQILTTRKSLGEQDSSDNKGVGITRLRYVDQQLRQQRALQQLGMMQQHAWRPQRGLPESSVSILRAWLFEHFLHPYPKDSDKIMLARQTGLTRSQVSNWFINARVRLWKPMVEEMYKEEFADTEMDSNSSSENAAKAIRGDDARASEDRGEDLPQYRASTSQSQLTESKSDHVMGDVEAGYGQVSGVDDCSIFPDTIIHHHDHTGSDHRFMAAPPYHHAAEMGAFGGGSGGVSLTLGLQNFEGGDGGGLPMPGGTHHSFLAMRGDHIYNTTTAGSSIGAEAADFEYANPGNRQHRFSSSQLLHDFVA